MKVACIVIPTASQLGKEKDKDKQQLKLSEQVDRFSRDCETNEYYRPHFKHLSNDIASLRDQVIALTTTVASLVEKQAINSTNTDHQTPTSQSASPAYTTSTVQQPREPKQPQFIGPTRSDFSFNIAETSLTRMGISPNDPLSSVPSLAKRRALQKYGRSRGSAELVSGGTSEVKLISYQHAYYLYIS